MDAPLLTGGESIDSYQIEYSPDAFVDEGQGVTIDCPDVITEVQSVTTSATGTPTDWSEQQVLALTTTNTGTTATEVQKIECDATGGSFTLSFYGQTAHINYDDKAPAIKAALENLSNINAVTVTVNNFTVARRARLACFGLTCGAPAALCRFAYVFAFRDSRTKTFTKTANDDGVELFCQEPDAMAVRSIVIRNNMRITARAMTAISFCFRTTKLDISGCSELSCGLCVYE